MEGKGDLREKGGWKGEERREVGRGKRDVREKGGWEGRGRTCEGRDDQRGGVKEKIQKDAKPSF